MSESHPLPPSATLDLDDSPRRFWRRNRILIGVALASLLFHYLLSLPPYPWSDSGGFRPAPVAVTQVDPKKLDAIRKQWAREKALLLNKNPNAPKDLEAPKDSNYISDRNIRVEKEQRARKTDVLPRPERKRTEAKPGTESVPAPSLSKLGIPLKLNAKKAQAQQAEQAQPAQSGADQSILDDTLPEGSENLLNAQESVYYSFYARIYEIIGPMWQSQINSAPVDHKLAPGEYITRVDVVMDADGRIVGVRRLSSSGIAAFDQAVDLSWRRAARFPNPPRGLLNERGEVHTGWSFAVRVGGGIVFEGAPPERNY